MPDSKFIVSGGGCSFETTIPQRQRAEDFESALKLYREVVASNTWNPVQLVEYDLPLEESIRWYGDEVKRNPHIIAPQSTTATLRFHRVRDTGTVELVFNVGSQFGHTECNCFGHQKGILW